MPEHSTWNGGRGGLFGKDRTRKCQFSPATFARMQFGDFNHFVGPAGYESTTQYDGWTTTVDGAGTIVMLDRVGGWLQLLSGGADGNGVNFQQAHESFLPAANRDIHFGCRIEVTEATELYFFAGLAITDTDIDTGSLPADIVGFAKTDGDANLDFLCQSTASGAVAQTDTGVDIAADTAIELGFTINGITNVKTYINGALDTTFSVAANTDIPVTEMAPAFSLRTGDNAIESLKIDWYSIVQNYV